MEKTLKKGGISKTLGLSDSASDWVTKGAVTDATSLRPYQTYYYLSNNYLNSKLKGNYSSVLLPKGSSTGYWVASRCVNVSSSFCTFLVRYVNSGNLYAYALIGYGGGVDGSACPLFPVVSLAASFIAGDATAGWSVE